ncbi:MAG: C40 family peptidase [Flavobacteriales bacterium]|nr:C40 family peptidase [Flavobacteriales bacterium]
MEDQTVFEVITATCPQRSEPKEGSEMVNQFLYNEPLQVIERHDKWWKVRSLIDQYEGWVDPKLIAQCSTTPKTQRQSAFLKHHSDGLYSTLGSFTSLNDKSNTSIIKDATDFLGAPYLWGGKTFMGIDCSGLMQILWGVHGVELPRDASQQVKIGMEIPSVLEAKNGDLAFFENEQGRITHVGIITIEDHKTFIIHASGVVRKDPLDQKGIFQEEKQEYSHFLNTIKRVKQ